MLTCPCTSAPWYMRSNSSALQVRALVSSTVLWWPCNREEDDNGLGFSVPRVFLFHSLALGLEGGHTCHRYRMYWTRPSF